MTDYQWTFAQYFFLGALAMMGVYHIMNEFEECRWRKENGLFDSYYYFDGAYREIDWPPAYWTVAAIVALKVIGILDWSWGTTIIGASVAGGFIAPRVSYWIIAYRHHKEERVEQARYDAWAQDAMARRGVEPAPETLSECELRDEAVKIGRCE